MKGSLIIVSFFIVGTFCGLYHLIPYEFTHSNLSYYALCGLMFCVGISIGNDPNTLKSFRSLNPRLLFLPVMTILGTLAGCAVASLFLPHRSATDCMAVGAGFGYYSLSSTAMIFCPTPSVLNNPPCPSILSTLTSSSFIKISSPVFKAPSAVYR